MEKSKNFTEGNVMKQLLIFSTPLFLSNLLQLAYNMIDMIIVGRVMGKTGISAVSVGGDIANFLTFLAMGFSNAAQVIIAQMIGAGEHRKIAKFVASMYSFLTLCAVALSVVCLVLRNPILKIMNTPAESYEQALGYATVCIAGLVFIYGYNMVSALLRGMGDSIHPFVFISMAAVINTALDVLLVVKFQMGAAGAALATVISQGASFVCCSCYIYAKRESYNLKFKIGYFVKWDWELLKELMKLGIPMAIKSASIQFSKLFVNSWINSYGVAVSAFAGIANKINSTTNLLSNAFNTAGASMIGQNIGAQKYERVKKVMGAVFKVTLSVATVLSVLFVLFPGAVYGIFTEEKDVIEIGMKYVPIAVLIFYGSALRSGMNALINGSGNYKINFATAIFDGVINRIGFALLFGVVFSMKQYGFWLGDALAGYTPFFIGIVFYWSGAWKKGVKFQSEK